MSFNPCSLGCCSERVSAITLCGIWLPVSILVLLDVALKVYAWGWRQGRESWFQSLFSWMLLWKLIFILILLFGGVVSILVLLDVALKGLLGRSSNSGEWSFNPCSLGCCSESRSAPYFEFTPTSFNPCSLGCCSESWMMALAVVVWLTVSILVLLDVALKVERAASEDQP